MDARMLLSLVKSAIDSEMDYYAFASAIIEAQREEDAAIADALNAPAVASAIRA